MTTTTLDAGRQNVLGSLWMVASMAAFSVEDVFLKLATDTTPVSLVMVAFGAFGMAHFAIHCVATRQSLVMRDLRRPSVVLRFCFELIGRLFFTLSLAHATLGSTVAILQAAPLVVVAGAAVMFGERVSAGRWLGIVVGLCGVVLILRPTASDFSALSLLAVFGMLGLALRDVATRAVPRSIPNSVLGFYSFASIVAAGCVYALWDGAPMSLPEPVTLAILTCTAFAGAMGYVALTEAIRTGDMSVVTPFRYTRLVCGAVFGFALFGEPIGATDVLGAALIMGSGLFVLARL